MAANRSVRKFIDLVRQISGKWVNWDPPIPVTVGDYGTLDENGELIVEGNVYDPDFQTYLDQNAISLDLSAHPPELGAPEQDYIATSIGARRGEFNVSFDRTLSMLSLRSVPGIASASVKGTWKFRNGHRGALIILHQPRQKFISKLVQTKILKAKLLDGKKVVTSAFACPAYLLYLSDGSGESISVALRGGTSGLDAVTGELGFGWWTDNECALLRRAFDPKGKHSFIPLFSLNEKVKRRIKFPFFGRGGDETESDTEYVWQEVYQPWKPLDEDGEVIEE